MKNLLLLPVLCLSLIFTSCNSNDDDSNENDDVQTGLPTEPQGTSFTANITGGTFTNYPFSLGVYQVTKGTNGNTLSIDVADTQGQNINLFLNGTEGFSNGTVKEMGNVDSDNFNTYAVIRDMQSQISYFSSSGNVTITHNENHPTEDGVKIISGTYNINAATIDGNHETNLTGTFTELEYLN